MLATETMGVETRVASLRANAKLFLESNSLPSNRHEEWRFSAVKKYFQEPFTFGVPTFASKFELPDYFHQCVGTKLVLQNGVLNTALSEILDDGFTLNVSNETIAYLGKGIIEPNYFTAINDVYFTYGLNIEITGNPTHPIHLFHIVDSPDFVLPRLLVVAKPNTEATINEYYFHNQQEAKVSSVAEIFVQKNATLYFNHVVDNNPKMSIVNTLEANCERDARFFHTSYSNDSLYLRNNTHIRLNDENAYGSLAGFYATKDESLTDNHVLIDHRKPNCESFQLFKGLLDNQSTAVFNGKIMVHVDAQKTNAFQSSKAVLLSNEATMNSKPQLEIFADDVKCSHGAAIGQMNKNEIFYFKARGIDEATAKAILNLAYTAEVLEKINDEFLRNYLLQSLKDDSNIDY